MGLTLIHGKSEPSAKPRIFVVAEQSVHDALAGDLELDVYPECFDYDSFVKASLSKTISTNHAIVIVSDSLSQRIAPLEAVAALVRTNVILIPWKSTEAEITQLNVASCSPRPTANTMRRAIFAHSGMNDLPPRFDGDDYIEEPPNAGVVSFTPRTEIPSDIQFKPKMATEILENSTESVDLDSSASPLEWFADPKQEMTALDKEFLPPAEQQQIEEQEKSDAIALREDSPSFLPEFFQSNVSPEPAQPPVETKAPQGSIDSFWKDETLNSDVQESASKTIGTQNAGQVSETEKWIAQAFAGSQGQDKSSHGSVSAASKNAWGKSAHPIVPEPRDLKKAVPLIEPELQGDSLELEAYVSNTADLDAYQIEESSPATFVPDVAFRPSDENGSQQMWTMFDEKMESPGAQNNNSLSAFPDGTDHRKAIHLAEPLTICVYSPKGGVGKTSISVNLAARLAYTTRLQVCIVDLDIAFGNVGTRLGLYNPTVRELLNESHIDGESLARNLVYDRRSGLFALLAPLRPETGTNRRKFSPAAYKKILSLLRERFDVVILDCPVELRDPLVSGFALTQASQVVMVVNNEQATLLDARRAVEAMCRPKDSQRLPGLGIDPSKVGLVVNQKVEDVGREVDDIKAILGGGDPNHPSRDIEVLSVIGDDRHLWVGNANMARTVATSGENDVDILLDEIWSKVLPGEAGSDFESQEFNSGLDNPLDQILSYDGKNSPKKKRKLNIFKKN